MAARAGRAACVQDRHLLGALVRQPHVRVADREIVRPPADGDARGDAERAEVEDDELVPRRVGHVGIAADELDVVGESEASKDVADAERATVDHRDASASLARDRDHAPVGARGDVVRPAGNADAAEHAAPADVDGDHPIRLLGGDEGEYPPALACGRRSGSRSRLLAAPRLLRARGLARRRLAAAARGEEDEQGHGKKQLWARQRVSHRHRAMGATLVTHSRRRFVHAVFYDRAGIRGPRRGGRAPLLASS